MKPATKTLSGWSYIRRGVSHCWSRPSLRTATRSTHGHGLDLVVGDVDGGDTEAALQRRDLRTGLDAELGVEVRQRLVHEEHLRATHDGAAHGDTLTLATGEAFGLRSR